MSIFKESDGNTPTTGYVLFFANWCGACKQFKPIWEQLKQNVICTEIDCTDGNKDMISKYNVTKLPTILIFKDGKNLGEYQGEMTREALIEFAKQNFESNEKPKENIENISKGGDSQNNYNMLYMILIILMGLGLGLALCYYFMNNRKK